MYKRQAIVTLSQSGHLDRDRLLDATLSGLHLEVKQQQLSGFHKLHQSLAPNKAERLARQAQYLELLSHKKGHVVKFALSMLGKLDKDGYLDATDFLAEVPSVFLQGGKGNAKACLKLIKRLIKTKPDLKPAALSVVCLLYTSPSPRD